MAGVSEMPFRLLALEMGAGSAPTELVSAKGLIYGSERTAQYLTHDINKESPFWVQLFGGEPEAMAEGAEVAKSLGAKILDINMGCPVKKVTRHGAGSALLQDPKRAAEICRLMHERTGLPITAKIRLGWDGHSLNALEVVKHLADAGCEAVAVHGRTRAQAYSGKADWDAIARLAEKSPLPIIGNGDIQSAEEARERMAQSGCAAVMIGRGALGNPWIFQALRDGDAHFRPQQQERWNIVRRHFMSHLDFVGDEKRAIHRYRQHFIWFSHGLRDATQFRREIVECECLSRVLELTEAFFTCAEYAKGDGSLPPCETKGALG
jgi:tRNA-dihydrouridine synthase B